MSDIRIDSFGVFIDGQEIGTTQFGDLHIQVGVFGSGIFLSPRDLREIADLIEDKPTVEQLRDQIESLRDEIQALRDAVYDR